MSSDSTTGTGPAPASKKKKKFDFKGLSQHLERLKIAELGGQGQANADVAKAAGIGIEKIADRVAEFRKRLRDQSTDSQNKTSFGP